MRGGGFGGSSGPPERSQQSGRWSVRAGSPGGGGSGGPEGPERLLKTGAGSVEKKPADCPFKASFRVVCRNACRRKLCRGACPEKVA